MERRSAPRYYSSRPSRSPVRHFPVVLLFWLAAAICLVAETAIVRAALHTRAAPDSALVPGPRRALEVLYALLPALFLGAVLVLTWRAIAAAPGA